MIKKIDDFLNKITMYRLVLYELIGLIGAAVFLGIFNLIPYSPVSIITSAVFLTIISWATNVIFSKVFEVPANVESVYITALILALIISPAVSINHFIFLGWAGVLSVASKYILTLGKKHIFNPAAIAVVITAIFLKQSASWWVGTASMWPFVVLGGILIVRKIRRSDMVYAFIISSLLTVSAFTLFSGGNLVSIFYIVIFQSSLVYFAFFMLTEPATTPPIKSLQIIYAALIGFLFAPQIHIGSIYSTPELALVIGNVFSYIVSPKQKLILKLKEKIIIGPDLFDFLFVPNRKFVFTPGQYMEWTLPGSHSDSRGNRRYFTIASSPTEGAIRLGVKFHREGSSYKKMMEALDRTTPIVGGQLAGDFTLPKDRKQKLVFVAGGIGITPYRSMIKYLIDTKEKRDIVLLYTAKTPNEIVYKDVFDQAQAELGIKMIYFITDKENSYPNWKGKVGRIDAESIKNEVSDYKERLFYLSGPNTLVEAFEKVLKDMDLPRKQIKKDYFPGY